MDTRDIHNLQRISTNPPTYRLCDEMREHIEAKFYEQELQKVTPPLLHQIKQILYSQRGADGKVRHNISWYGYLE